MRGSILLDRNLPPQLAAIALLSLVFLRADAASPAAIKITGYSQSPEGHLVLEVTTPFPNQPHQIQATDQVQRETWPEVRGTNLETLGPHLLRITVPAKELPVRFFRVRTSQVQQSLTIDLGVAPSYEVGFDQRYDYAQLAADGIHRINLYYTWKEFELGRRDPNHPEGSLLEEELDPIIDRLQSLGMKTSIIIEITDTDCDEKAPEACWLEFGIPKDLLYDTSQKFVGFDHEQIAAPLEDFIKHLVQRYPANVVTHVLIGNETDQYLNAYGHVDDYIALMDRLKSAVASIPNRAKTGTIFTFAPDTLVPGYNKIARQVAPRVEVMGFTIYPFLYEAILNETAAQPTPEFVANWFNAAIDVVQNRPFVVTETAHPAAGRFGTTQDQINYTQFLLDYLKETAPPIEFITWWGIEDADTHPFEGFRNTGLKENNEAKNRPSFDLWRAGIDGGK